MANQQQNMLSGNATNLALLIDGDNVSAKNIAGLMAEIAKYGTASVRRIYGDWTDSSTRSWKNCLLDYSILPIQQFAYTQGKNSTDGAMIIDAMDLLYTGRFSGFCIVSSDSDFTRLAARIREQGVTVYGFGERKTNSAFIAACDKFVYFDVLNTLAYRSKNQSHSPQASGSDVPSLNRTSQVLALAETPKRPLDAAALAGLAKVIELTGRYENGFANLADVGMYWNRISPKFNARNYGYERLYDLVEATGLAELKMERTGNLAPIALARLKEGFVDTGGDRWQEVSAGNPKIVSDFWSSMMASETA